MITAQNIFEKGILISMRTGRYEGINKLSKEQLKDLPQEIVRGIHDLFKKDFKNLLNGVISFDSKARDEVKRQSVPFPIEGLYFIWMEKVADILGYLDDCAKERQKLVEEILAKYEQAIADFAAEYPDYYQKAKSKYLSADRLRQRYFFKYQFVKIGAPDKNNIISADQYRGELAKFKDTVEDMKRDVVATIYQELLQRTTTIKKQCADGKPNQLTFNALTAFLEKIDDLYKDFVDRKDMKEVIQKIKAQTLGVTADSLRDNEKAKDEFKASIAVLAEEIKALPDIPLKRAIEF